VTENIDRQLWDSAIKHERERLLARKNDIINSVVNYSLGNHYDRVVADLTKIIMDEDND
jgi:hypothetical protein